MKCVLSYAALFLLALPLFAGNDLGDEYPLGTPAALQKVPGSQTITGLASNGSGFLATWSDTRATFGRFGSVAPYAGPIDRNGVPQNLEGVKLPPLAAGPLTSIGNSYAIAYRSGTSGFLQFLGSDARPSGGPTPIDLTATPTQIASNGATLLAIQPDGVVVVDSLATGHAISVRRLAEGRIASAPVLLSNGDYAFVVAASACNNPPCDGPVTLVVVDGTSGAMTTHALFNPGPVRVSLAAVDDTLLLGWVESAGVKSALFDRDGRALASPVSLPQTAGSGSVTVGSDGRQFLLAIGGRSLVAYRVSATGQLRDASGITLSTAMPEDVAFARADGSVAVVWDERASSGDLHAVTRAAADFDALLGAPTHDLAFAAPAQEWPRLSSRGNLAAWIENGSIVTQTIGGAPVVLPGLRTSDAMSAPAVAGSAGMYLVVWAVGNASGTTTEARRVDLYGNPIDADPIVIGHSTVYPAAGVPPPAVASDGTDFLVVWPDETGLRGSRVSLNGHLLDAAPLTVVTPRMASDAMVARVVWTGDQYVVGSLEQLNYALMISPTLPAPSLLRLVRVTASGTVLDSAPRIFWQAAPADSMGLAVAGSGVAAFWNGLSDRTLSAQQCLWATWMDARGGTVVAPRELRCAGATFPPTFATVDVAWSGSELVAVWADDAQHVAMAQRFDGALQPIDAQPFAVSPPGSIAGEPSIAPTPDGTAIAYVRVADELQYGGVPRAFVRTVPRRGLPHKHAAGR